MRKLFTLILLIKTFTIINAQNFSWARMDLGNGTDEGSSIVADAAGNVYTVGEFEGSADFDPGAGTSYLTSAGFIDVFIQKVDASGNLVWVKRIGGTNKDYAVAVDVDALGNVYIMGSFSGTIDLDPSAAVYNITQTSTVQHASFIVKLNSSGNFVWGKQFGGTPSGGVRMNDMKLNAAGEVIVIGECIYTNDMDPNAGTATMTAIYTDGFILNLTAAGNYGWAKQFRSTGSATPYSIPKSMDIDRYGNIVITGSLKDTTDLDPGAGVAKFTGNGFNYFVAKYTSAGAYRWAGSMTNNIWSGDIATDTSGNVIIISSGSGIIDFDMSASVNNVSASGLCVQKIDSLGNFLWAKSWAQASSFYQSVCTDANSNIYITGYFVGTSDFNPGAGVYSQTSTLAPFGFGAYDVYIVKIDYSGNFISALKYGSNFDDQVNELYVDASGNIYSTGSFEGYGDFDPGAGVVNLNTNGNMDIFVQKLSPAFTLNWVFGIGGETYQTVNAVSKTMKNYAYSTGAYEGSASLGDRGYYGGTDIMVHRSINTGSLGTVARMGGTGNDGGTAIITDTSDNIYVAGYFQNTANFAPSFIKPAFNMTSAGATDIFILKINSLNNLVWAKRIGGTSDELVNGMTLDKNGNLYLTGYFQGTVDFNPAATVNNLVSAGGLDAFVLKLDTVGNYIWARNMGGTNNDLGNDITVDASGNVITTGIFNGTADFNPSVTTNNLTSVGSIDMFVQKLNSAGNFVWAKSVGSTANEYGTQVIVDSTDNVIIAGKYGGTTDFDPNAGTFNLTPPNNLGEIFLLQLTSAGNFSWAKTMGASGVDDVKGLNIDRFGTIYLTGSFEGTADFDPNPLSTFNLTSNGNKDAFILAYHPSVAGEFWARSIGGTGNDDAVGLAVDNAFSVYTIGNFYSTVDFNPGAGSFNLTSLGNPDIYALKLIQPILLPIELISFIAHCQTDKVVLNWITASESNNDYFEIERSEDAINFHVIAKINTQNGNSTNMLIYSFEDINPLTGDSYYRLKQVDNNGQFSYSKITTVDCHSSISNTTIHLYPNPTEDKFFISVENIISEVVFVKIFNAYSALVFETQWKNPTTNSLNEININHLPTGTYFIQIYDAKNMLFNQKVIKK